MDREDQLDELLKGLKAGTIGINLEESDKDTSDKEEAENKTSGKEISADANSSETNSSEAKAEGKAFDKEEKTKKSYKKEEKANSLVREILSWIEVLVMAAVIAFCINTFIIANSKVPTGSMETTIMPGDRVIGSRLHYRFGEPERGDIAIFVYPDDEARGIRTYYVKRVIGMPGDTIDIVDGKVYLNGSAEPLDEPYIREEMELEPPMHFEVPEDSYFMMGDNRNYSSDSRRWRTTHYVKREKMVAKVMFQYFPKLRKLN